MSDDVPTTWEDVFKHKRFKELSEKAKTAEDALAKLQADLKAAKDAQTAQAAELKTAKDALAAAKAGQTDLEKLTGDLAALQSKFEQSQQSLATEQAQRLRLEIATEKGLPSALAARLTGSTREELLADAEALMPLLKPVTPGVPPAPPRTPPQPKFTPEQLADPEYVRKNTAAILKEAAAST